MEILCSTRWWPSTAGNARNHAEIYAWSGQRLTGGQEIQIQENATNWHPKLQNIGELFLGLPNLIFITDDVLIAGFNDLGRGHHVTFDKVLRLCREANIKHYKDKCLFRYTSIPFFGEIISQNSMSPDPRKVQLLMGMPSPKCKNEFQSFLGILNYLSKVSLVTAKVWEPLRKLKSVRTGWSWSGMYKDLHDKAKC